MLDSREDAFRDVRGRADKREVINRSPHSRAGDFADQRFRSRRRAWRRRVWWVTPVVGLAELGVAVGLGQLLQPEHLEFYAGMGAGIALAMVMCFWDSPPPHIDRWRLGAEGERATAKALRPLLRRGWVVVHDIDVGRGNIDHVLIGPAGVFVLESKNISGTLAVREGVLYVRWREDPSDGYESPGLSRRMRARAALVSQSLREAAVPAVWVQPLVVLWGRFDQRSIESDRVAWVRGRDLATVLAARPVVLDAAAIAAASAALDHWIGKGAEPHTRPAAA